MPSPASPGPQLYLVAPPALDPASAAARLAPLLDRFAPACLRVPAAGDPASLGRLADVLRDLAHARDIAVVIEDHVALALRHGLDGVHLSDGARGVRAARTALGPDAIVGAGCGASRHEGITAGEAGADYIAFGPAGDDGLGRPPVPPDLFAWWSEMIELPVVAEGGLDAARIAALAPVCDFLALGPELWAAPDPAAALAALWPPHVAPRPAPARPETA